MSKKNAWISQRALALTRHPCRLAVLRSVALPRPRTRIHQTHHPALARFRADRHLRLRRPGRELEIANQALRINQSALGGKAGRANAATLGVVPRRTASDVSRCRCGRALCAARLPVVSGSVDRGPRRDGTCESIFRTSRLQTDWRDSER